MTALPTSSQINLTTLLVFSKGHASIIRGAVDVGLFEDDFQRIATAVYGYLDAYGECPGEAHVHDVLRLPVDSSGDDERQKTLRECLNTLHQTWSTAMNVDFVMDQLENFIQVQSRKQALEQSIDLLTNHGDEQETPAKFDALMRGVETNALGLLEMGSLPLDKSSALEFLTKREPSFTTGIKKIDDLGIGPHRKELHLFVALPGRGKSHWLVNLGLRAWRENYCVLHVTLEMSEVRVQQRYLQSALAIPSYDIGNPEVVKMELAPDGSLLDFKKESITYNFALDDPRVADKIRKALENKLKYRPGRAKKLLVKEFSSGSLTIPQLSAFLDTLRDQVNFVPDLLLLDYVDIMRLNYDNMRASLDQLYVQLRGLAVERNLAIATASQSNRKGMERGGVSMATLAEHFGKAMITDIVFSYNQTSMEKRLGLARVRVEKARNAEDKFEILIKQRYELCQFVIQSIFHRKDYEDTIAEAAEVLGLGREEIEKYTKGGLYVDGDGEE